MVQGVAVSNSFNNQSFPSYVTGTLDQSGNAPSYFAGPDNLNMSSEISARRAHRYDFALGEQSPGVEKLYEESLYGEEGISRAQRAIEGRTQLNLKRTELAKNYLTSLPAGSVTEDDINFIQNMDKRLVDQAYANPETFYERLYAQKATTNVVQDLYDNGEDPRDDVGLIAGAYTPLMTNQNIAIRLLEEAQSKMDTRTWGQAAKEWIPFWRWLKLSSNFENEFTEGGFTLGTNMRDQVEALYRLKPDEFYDESKKILDDLSKSDPGLAMSFANALVGYSASSELMDDINSYLDLSVFGVTPKGIAMTGAAVGIATTSTVLGVGSVTANAVRAMRITAAHGRMKNLLKNQASGSVDYVSLLPEYRKAHQSALASLRAKAANTNQVGDFDALMSTIQDIHNPQTVLTGAVNMTAEEAARIEIGLLKTATNAADNFINRPNVLNRLTPEEQALALSQAEQYVDIMYAKSTLGSRVVKVKSANIEQSDNLANVDAIKFYLGNAKSDGYATRSAALGQAKKLGLQKYDAEEINGKWYISLVQYVDETTPSLRSFAKSEKMENRNRVPYLHWLTSRVRSRDTLVPEQLMEDLLVAQSSVNRYFDLNRSQFLEDFGKLSGKAKRRFDEFLERERDYRFQDGPPDTVVRGRYAANVGEFQQRWLQDYGSLPSIEEVQTYFAWKNWNDIDFAVRNLDLTRDKVRLGVGNHELRLNTPGNETEWTPKLEGKILNEFPWDRPGNAGILVWDSAESHLMAHPESYKIPGVDYGKVRPPKGKFQKAFIRDFEKEYIDNLIQRDGYRVLHLSPYSKQDLADYLGDYSGRVTPEVPLIPEVRPADLTAKVNSELRTKYQQGTLTAEERKLFDEQYRAETLKFERLYQEETTEVGKQFYSRNALIPEFREIAHSIEDPVEQLNALADFLVDKGGKSGAYSVSKHASANKFLEQIASYKAVTMAERGVNSRLTQQDLKKLNLQLMNVSSGKYPVDRINKDLAPKLAALKTAGGNTGEFKQVVSNLSKDIADQYEILPVDKEGKLLGLMNNPSGLGKVRTALGSGFKKETPYYIISEKGSDLSQATNIVINGDAKNTKKFILEHFPDANVMTPSQAATWMRTGKAPAKPIAQQAEEAAVAATPEEGFSIGDEVIALTAEDKKELAKTGTIKAADKAQRHKVSAVVSDPKRPDLGTYIRLEGSQTAFPASDLYLVNPSKAVSPTVKANYEKGLDVGRYDYILVHPDMDVRSTTLDFMSIPRTEGGHMVNEDPWHVRQAQLYDSIDDRSRVTTYEGDVNAYTAVIEDDARATATHLENMRAMLKRDYDNGTNFAEAEYNNSLDGLSKDFKTFKNQFKEFHKQGKLRLDRPFVVTAKDRSSYDSLKAAVDANGNPLYPNLQNHRDSAHNLFYNELNLQYAMERSDGLERIARKGTKQRPIFGSESGGNLSPMAALINSQSQLLRNRMLTDLKHKNAENFAKYYSDVIDAPLEEIRKDPMEYILNPKWKQGLKGNDLRLLNSAKDYRRAVVDFMGVNNPVADNMKLLQSNVAEELKKKLGQGSYEHIDRHLLRGRHISPVRWANALVYDLFFGMFNLKQLLVQSMTSYHTAAVLGPITGVRAGTAAHIARWFLSGKEITPRLQYVAKKMEAAGVMQAKHFEEAVDSYRKSGFHIIGQETSYEDDFLNDSLKKTAFETGRDYARVFFKEGDRFSRTTAYMGAYMEWRKLNPTAKLTSRIEAQLLNRANTLSLSMTGASQAAMAKGAGNIPLKFTTYHLRVMEQLLPGWTGGPLTAKEKMRAYAMYSAAFGVPITASGTFGLWPFHKEVAKTLMDNGYETDENLVLKAFNDGLAELLPSLIGVDQNFSETLGPSGTNWLYDIVNGRTPIFDVVTGVGGQKIFDVFTESWPFFTLMANAFRDDDEKYPLSLSDWENFIRSSSSVNNYWRAIQMYNTGNYMTKNGTVLMRGVDTGDIISSLFAGSQPKEVQRAFNLSDMTRATQDMKNEAKKDILRWHRLKMKAIVDGDLDAMVEYGKKIKMTIAANGFRHDEFNRLFTDIVNENKDLVNLAERQFNSSTPERQKMHLNKIEKERQEEIE